MSSDVLERRRKTGSGGAGEHRTLFLCLLTALLAVGNFDATALGRGIETFDPAAVRILAPELREKLAQRQEDEFVEVVVRMAPRQFEKPLRKNAVSNAAQARQRVASIKEHSALTQAGVNEVVAQEKGTVINSFWIANAALIKVRVETLNRLALLPDVWSIHENFEIQIHPSVEHPPLQRPLRGSDDEPTRWPLDSVHENSAVFSLPTEAIRNGYPMTWGLARIGVAEVWDKGIDGTGVRVAVSDTGVDMDHPDLAGKMVNRDNDEYYTGGWIAFNSSGLVLSDSVPHDSQGHGTHCSGTVLGGNAGGAHIGVAPGARLMHVLGLPGGSGTFACLAAGLQWKAEPHDRHGTPLEPVEDYRPHVASMSWGGGGYNALWEEFFINLRNAGVIPVASSGNSGHGAINTPGGIYEVFGIGAAASNDTIATFSTGAIIEDGRLDTPEQYVQPDFSAPGVQVYSARTGGGYVAYNGTSMAAPHVAGAVALMLTRAHSAETVYDTLAATADYYEAGLNLGEQKNTRYGYGIINADKAVAALSSFYVLSPTDIGKTNATFHVRIVEMPSPQADLFFQYRTKGEETWHDSATVSISESGLYETTVFSLTGNTQYLHRAVMAWDNGEETLQDFTFSVAFATHRDVMIETLDPENIWDATHTPALRGAVTRIYTDEASLHFQYRAVGAETWIELDVGSLTEPGEFSLDLAGLSPFIPYEYKAVAKANGETYSGRAIVFEIGAIEPEWCEQRLAYLISNVYELQWMRHSLGSDYLLVNDIDASDTVDWYGGKGFEPVGTVEHVFSGNFDGQGYAIEDMHIVRPDTGRVGLFGTIKLERSPAGGTVKNVGLKNVRVEGYSMVGGLVGQNEGLIVNAYTTGEIVGNSWFVGGLVGFSGRYGSSLPSEARIIGSYSTARVSHGQENLRFLGGLAGLNQASIENSFAGGLVSTTNSYYTGGLVGLNQGLIRQCFATGDVKDLGSNPTRGTIGGLVGSLMSEDPVQMPSIVESFATGDVTGSSSVGGLVGSLQRDGGAGRVEIRDSFARGNVTQKTQPYEYALAGGLAGNFGVLYSESEWNDASVDPGRIVNAYATGKILSQEGYENSVGGFLGMFFDERELARAENSFWDMDTSEMAYSAAGTGKTTAEMKTAATFTNTVTAGLDTPWNFVGAEPGDGPWDMAGSYPVLVWHQAIAAPRIEFGVHPASTPVDTTVAPPVTVRIVDGYGILQTNVSHAVTVALASPNGATLSGATNVATVGGMATFENLSVDRPGVYTLIASASGMAARASELFAVYAATGSPASVSLAGPASATAGETKGPFLLTVRNGDNEPVPALQDTAYTLSSTAVRGLFTPSAQIVVEAGRAEAVFHYTGIDAGTQTVAVVFADGDPALAGMSDTALVTIHPAEPTQIHFVQGPTDTTAGFDIDPPPSVWVEDKYGNAHNGLSLEIGIRYRSGDAALNGTRIVATVAGLATFDGLSLNKVGSYTLFATPVEKTSAPLAESSVFSVVPGAAAQIALDGPDNALLDTVRQRPFRIAVLDANGNATAVNGETVFALHSDGVPAFYADPDGVGLLPDNRIVMPDGESTALFYYRNSTAGLVAVTATAQAGGDPGLAGQTVGHDILIADTVEYQHYYQINLDDYVEDREASEWETARNSMRVVMHDGLPSLSNTYVNYFNQYCAWTGIGSARDMEMLTRIKIKSGSPLYFATAVRACPGEKTGYVGGDDGDASFLSRWPDGYNLGMEEYVFNAGDTIWIRMSVMNSAVTFKAWLDGNEEPDFNVAPMALTGTDPDPPAWAEEGGYPGFASYFSDASGNTIHFLSVGLHGAAAPNPYPLAIVSASPASPLSLGAGETAVFSVDLDNPGGQEPAFTWWLDGVRRPETGAQLEWIAPARLDAAQYRIRMTATDRKGSWVTHEWTVDVAGQFDMVGPVGHWRLDEESGTRYDASGYDNHLTDNGSVGSATGKIGRAAAFAGTNWLDIPESEQQGLNADTALTLAAWIRPNTVSGRQSIMSKYDYGNNRRSYRLELNDGTLKVLMSGNGSSFTEAAGVSNIATGQWSHAAAVFDGETIRLYLNGELERTVAAGFESLFKSSAPFTLGANWQSGSVQQRFNGRIDEARIYRRALPAEEIADVMEDYFIVRIGRINIGDDWLRLYFDSRPGRLYDVLYKNDLISTNEWQILINDIAGTGAEIEWEDPNPGRQRFYRIIEKE